MSYQVPRGFSLQGLHCGIKTDSAQEDICLVLADRPCVAAGVYTQNQVVAAPVIGARSLEQLEPCLKATEIEMTEELREAVRAISPAPAPATDRNEETTEFNYGKR